MSSLGMAMVMGFQQVVFAGVAFYLTAAALLTIHGRRMEREKTGGGAAGHHGSHRSSDDADPIPKKGLVET